MRLKVDIIVAGGIRRDSGSQECDQDDSHRYEGRGPILLRLASLKALPVPAATSRALQPSAPELGGKRLELLKEAVPKACPCRGSLRSDHSGAPVEVKEDLPVAARALGLNIQPWEIRDAEDFERYSLR